jgi:uncharacterized membrane protein
MADSFEPTSPPPAPEPIPPNPNPPPEPPPRGETTQSTGLPSNIAAALACIPLVGGLIFWFLEKHDSFVRFYAMQSIIFGGAWILISIACALISGLLGAIPVSFLAGPLQGLWNMVGWLIYIALFVIVIVTIARALSGVRWEIPYIGSVARKQVEGGVPSER